MKKIIFLHGFFASGNCEMARALRQALAGKGEVMTPDLPLHPVEALEYVHTLCDQLQPDLLVGNSCGAFLAQMLAPIVGVPALLGNPHLGMTDFLLSRRGPQQYKAPRTDGRQQFVVDEALIDEFATLQERQFACTSPYFEDRVWGLFGEKDTLAHYQPLFEQHYTRVHHFPGAHTPTADEVAKYYAPLAAEMLERFPRREQRLFRHFKGRYYRLLHSAHDSETAQRMVVYQALYGGHAVWVRPEQMFFEHVTRNGTTQPRFVEVDALLYDTETQTL